MKDEHKRMPRTSRALYVAAVVVTATAVALLLAFVNPSANAGTAAAGNPGPWSKLGGRDADNALLRGLFFGLGPVAEAYPKLALTRVADTADNDRILAGLIADVGQREPDFLHRFANAMYSGDRVLIRDVAAHTSQALQQALLRTYPNVSARSPDGNAPDLGGGKGQCVAMEIAVVAVAVVVAVVMEVYNWAVGTASSSLKADALRFEQWVDDVATTLRRV